MRTITPEQAERHRIPAQWTRLAAWALMSAGVFSTGCGLMPGRRADPPPAAATRAASPSRAPARAAADPAAPAAGAGHDDHGAASGAQAGANHPGAGADAKDRPAAKANHEPAGGTPALPVVAPAGPGGQPTRRVPINLPTVLRLVNADNLEIALAQERIEEARALRERALVGVLPTVMLGADYLNHDGRIQKTEGQVETVDKSALAAGANAVAVLSVSDAIFEPNFTRQIVGARRARLRATVDDVQLRASEAYIDLVTAEAALAAAREVVVNATELERLTRSFKEAELGLEADVQRVRSERRRRQLEVVQARSRVVLVRARLARLLRVDPRYELIPAEAELLPLALVPDRQPVDPLVVLALENRPELAEHRALVQATLDRLREAQLRPLVPSIIVRSFNGEFGGGPRHMFDNFGPRNDYEVVAQWTLTNLGLGDHATIRRRSSVERQATLDLLALEDQVAAEVVEAFEPVATGRAAIAEAEASVRAALVSLELNLRRIRGFEGLPIEALQAVQALAAARSSYQTAVNEYNKAQFRLFRAIGRPPLAAFARLAKPGRPAPPPDHRAVPAKAAPPHGSKPAPKAPPARGPRSNPPPGGPGRIAENRDPGL